MVKQSLLAKTDLNPQGRCHRTFAGGEDGADE